METKLNHKCCGNCLSYLTDEDENGKVTDFFLKVCIMGEHIDENNGNFTRNQGGIYMMDDS